MGDADLWEVLPFDAGSFTFPDDEPWPGEQGVVVAHLLRSEDGRLFLFDTGIGAGHPVLDARYHPVERPVTDALAALGHGAGGRRRGDELSSPRRTRARTTASPGSRSTSSAPSARRRPSPATPCSNGWMGPG